jgi:chromosome segregation ATPase
MNSDSGTTEWSEAIAVSDQRNKEAFLADLEARYVALESERDQLHERALRESERAAALEKRAVDLQHALSNAEMDLTKIGRDSQTDKDKALTAESQQKMLQERLTRLEEEGDSLREEIR